MPVQKKKIKVEYYGVFYNTYDKEKNTIIPKNEKLNLENFFENLAKKKIADRTYKYNGEKARIQAVKKEGEYWILNLIRVRDGYIPGKGNDAGDFGILKLEDDEWIGEEITILYDSINGTMLIQRNRNSLSVSGIQEFFNYLLNDLEHILDLRPKYSKVKELESDNGYTKFDITFDMSKLNGEDIQEYKWFTQLFSGVKDMNGSRVTISITNGRRKKEEYNLNSKEILRLPGLASIDGVEKLEIGMKQHPDSNVELLDLINNKLYDYITLEYSRENPINHLRVKKLMIEYYKKKMLNGSVA